MNSRRSFLKQMSGAALAVGAVPSLLSWAGPAQSGAIDVPGEDGMIVRSFRFVDLETPVEYFNTWLTPVPHFFVRNHMHEPSELDAEDWRLTIGGEVEKPFTLTLSELSKLEISFRGQHARVRRQRTQPLSSASSGHSVGQRRGRYRTLLWPAAARRFAARRREAGGQARYVPRTGEVPGKVPPFIRSIPIEKALDSDTLIATHMNGAPLTKHHGFPARALVPGWIGAASCKWLTEIKILESEFVGNFMSPGISLSQSARETWRSGEA